MTSYKNTFKIQQTIPSINLLSTTSTIKIVHNLKSTTPLPSYLWIPHCKYHILFHSIIGLQFYYYGLWANRDRENIYNAWVFIVSRLPVNRNSASVASLNIFSYLILIKCLNNLHGNQSFI
jgi:hypothetical protein